MNCEPRASATALAGPTAVDADGDQSGRAPTAAEARREVHRAMQSPYLPARANDHAREMALEALQIYCHAIYAHADYLTQQEAARTGTVNHIIGPQAMAVAIDALGFFQVPAQYNITEVPCNVAYSASMPSPHFFQ